MAGNGGRTRGRSFGYRDDQGSNHSGCLPWGMTVRMLTIATVLPDTQIHQPNVARLFADQPDMTRLGSRLVGSAFAGSGVATRHTVLPELGTQPRRHATRTTTSRRRPS